MNFCPLGGTTEYITLPRNSIHWHFACGHMLVVFMSCRKQTHCRFVLLLYCIFKQVWVVCCIGGDHKVCSHLLSKTSSNSWAFLHSSSAGGKLLPTLVKSAAILLLRRKPAALRFNPWSTQASTAATHTYIYKNKMDNRTQMDHFP